MHSKIYVSRKVRTTNNLGRKQQEGVGSLGLQVTNMKVQIDVAAFTVIY